MSKRTKPTPEIVANLPQAEGALAEMAAIDRKLAIIEASMNTAIDAAKTHARQEGEPLLERRKALADAVGTFAALNKSDLFTRQRSLDLAFGVIGFRQSAQLAQQTRITAAMTLEKLREYGFTDAIRTKDEVNKEAMAGWPDERLELVGMKRRHLDTFFIEIKVEEVKNAA